MTYEFDDATAVAPDGTCAVHDGWDIGGNANGGYLLALAANGLRDIAGRRDPVTVTAHYLAPGKPGASRVEGTLVKSGRRFATVSGSLSQGDRPLLQVLATFGDLAASAAAAGPTAIDGGPPDLPPIEDCVPRNAAQASFPVAIMDRLSVYLRPSDVASANGTRSGNAEVAGWFGFADDRPIDTLALLLIADAFPPAVFNLDIAPGWVPTVEYTVHVRSVPAPGPVRCVFRTRFVHSGMLEEDGEVWDSTDTLVAQSRQLALMPLA